MAKTDSLPLLLFAKAPVAGQVKTRLQSKCSAQQAADIAAILLEQSIIKAKRFWPGEVYLSVWLDSDHAFVQRMVTQYSLALVEQAEGHLGMKMHAAFEAYGYPAAILGCDAPHLLGADLNRAYYYLKRGKCVLGPSLDGGYYFIGLSYPQAQIFGELPWGTDQVLSMTLNRLDHTPELLSKLNDVDRWEDLAAAAAKLPALDQYLSGLKAS